MESPHAIFSSYNVKKQKYTLDYFFSFVTRMPHNQNEGRLNVEVQDTPFHEKGSNRQRKQNKNLRWWMRGYSLLPLAVLLLHSRCPSLKDLLCNLNTSSVLWTEITNFVYSIWQQSGRVSGWKWGECLGRQTHNCSVRNTFIQKDKLTWLILTATSWTKYISK